MTTKHLDRDLIRETPLPFRIYDATKKRFLLYYIYKHKLHAMKAAYWIVRWLEVGSVLEVIDMRTMRLHGSYTMHADGNVSIMSETGVKNGLHVKHTRS